MNNRQDGFVFDENETLEYTWPVTIVKPGSNMKHRVELTFRSHSLDELKALEEQSRDDEDEIPNMACDVVVGWPTEGDKTFRLPDGTVLQPTEDNKRKLFNQIYISRAVMSAFFQSQGGKKQK